MDQSINQSRLPTVSLAVIQASPFCNINCRYCYLPQRSSTKRISNEILMQVAKALFDSSFVNESLTILWHVGEPLVLPIEFYETAFAIFEQANTFGIKITHTIQTNATLINQRWCDFFMKHKVKIGVSIDGPQHIHDSNRVDRQGRGTFRSVMRGINLLQDSGIAFSIIMVVTSDAMNEAEEIWRFFIDNKITDIAFLPEEAEGVNRTSSIHSDEYVLSYEHFLRRMFELREAEDRPVAIRELDEFVGRIMSFDEPDEAATHNHLNNPLYIVSFDCDGNMSTFSPELLSSRFEPYGDFIFGNVMCDSLESMLAHDKFKMINLEIQRGKNECAASCEYFRVCGGGDPSNKVAELGRFDGTETMSCRFSIKANFNAVLSHLESTLGLS